MDDDDDWQEMPVIASGSGSTNPRRRSSSGSLEGASDDTEEEDYSHRYQSYQTSTSSSRKPMSGIPRRLSPSRRAVGSSSGTQSAPLTNATGRSLKLNDARGYDWRSKPAGAPGMHSSPRSGVHGQDGRNEPQKLDPNHNSDDDSEEESDDEKGQGYTQLRLDEDEEGDKLHDATSYLFGDSATSAANRAESSIGYSHQSDSTATPLSQMMTTKSLLSEPQKIAYVGLCALKAKEMVRSAKRVPGANKELSESVRSLEEWEIKVMARLFQHMDIDPSEQAMIKSLGEHGVLASDLAPSLITTQEIENPDYDPIAAQDKEEREAHEREVAEQQDEQKETHDEATSAAMETLQDDQTEQTTATTTISPTDADHGSTEEQAITEAPGSVDTADRTVTADNAFEVPSSTDTAISSKEDIRALDEEAHNTDQGKVEEEVSTKLAARVDPNSAAQATAIDANAFGTQIQSSHLGLTSEPQTVQPLPSALPGVTTELSTSDTHITLDLRWTVLCDLFLVMTADSVYDARSRVLLERVAEQLGLTWMDVTKFEKRVTDALEIEEGVEKLKDKTAISRREAEARKKKWAMIGLATVGGGLVIGLSAGLAAPLVGAGLAGFLGTVGIGGTTSFLGGVGGAALITTTGAVGGATLGGRGMNRRTQSVKTFAFKPIHNNKRVNCIVTVPGFMNGDQDDVRLPFSVIDSIMGDVFSVLWEPEMMKEMGNAIYILWNETLVMGVQQVLAATIAGGLLGALAWPLWLSKLGYLIDNPWSNATTRAEAAGKILADVLSRRQLGVRPITLVGFSLGARAIFYALHELAKKKAFGVVQNVYLFGAPVTANDRTWKEVRSVVAGRFVNGFSRTDWILGYLFRATSGGLRSIAGLHPVERVPDIENVDVTTSVPGHLQYRAFMPLVMSEVGFKVTQDWFDEPEDLSKIPDRQMVLDDLAAQEEEEREMKTISSKTGGFGRIFRRNKAEGNAGSSSTSNTTSADVSRPATPAMTVAGGIPVPRQKAEATKEEYDEADADAEDADLPPREERTLETGESSEQVVDTPTSQDHEIAQTPEETPSEDRVATPEAEVPPHRSAYVDTDAILAELRESGIEVKELKSSLPALSLASVPVSPAIKDSPFPPGSGQKVEPLKEVTRETPSPTAIRQASTRPSLKSSMSSLFGSRKASSAAPSSPGHFERSGAPSPAATNSVENAPSAVKMETPSLSVPGGVYAQGNTLAASSSTDSSLDPSLSQTQNNTGNGWDDKTHGSEENDTYFRSGSKMWAKPFTSSAALERDLPLQPPGYAPPPDVNLSFASDFDEEEDGQPKNNSSSGREIDADSGARNYGLSAEEARDLARRFGRGGDEATLPSDKNVFSSNDLDSGGWGATTLSPSESYQGSIVSRSRNDLPSTSSSDALARPNSDGLAGGWGGNGYGYGYGAEQEGDIFATPSYSMITGENSNSLSLPRPLESSYVGSRRTKDEDSAEGSGNKMRTNMSFQEASENPWG